MELLHLEINEVYKDWNSNMGTAGVAKNPIMKLQNVGNSMVEHSVDYANDLKIYFGIIAGVVSTASMNRKFLYNGAKIIVKNKNISVLLKKKTHLPILLDSSWFKKMVRLNWMGINIDFDATTVC